MSERQAKRNRKEQPVKVVAKKKPDYLVNGIIALVIIGFASLGSVAVVNEYRANDGVTTVKEYAKENGITVDEFMSKYGLEGKDVKPGTEINEASSSMPLDKYAEYSGTTVEELKAQSGWGDEVTNEMTITEAQDYTKIGNMIAGMGMDYAEYLAMFGLTEEELPADTTMKDAQPIIEAAQAKMQEEQAAAETEAETEAEAVTETEAEEDNSSENE